MRRIVCLMARQDGIHAYFTSWAEGSPPQARASPKNHIYLYYNLKHI